MVPLPRPGICQSPNQEPYLTALALPKPRNQFCLGKGRGAQQQRGLDPEAWLCPGCCVPWPQTPPPQTSPTVAQAPARPGSWLDQQGPLLCN